MLKSMNNYKAPNFHRVVGIDPDIDLNGFAFIEDNVNATARLSFWDLYDHLKNYKKSQLVYLEAGWLNKSIWQDHPKQSISVRKKIAKNVGENHGVGKMIEQMLIYLKIPYVLIQPKRSKTTPQQFKKLTGFEFKKSQQEEIDAFMLIIGLKTKKQ